MRYHDLGTTGVRVSAIALGSATFGVAPDEDTAQRIVSRAIELGVNLFDCANTYGNQPRFDRPGAKPADLRDSAEQILGRALKGRREEVVLCSKVMEPVGKGPNDHGLSRLHIFNQVERSLGRLDTDHIDIYYAHHPDPSTPLHETLRAFDDLTRQGKIRYYALSTYLPSQLVEALWISDKLGMRGPVCNQVPYNLANREHERDLVPACMRHGVVLTAFSPLAGGLFGGSDVLSRSFKGHARWGGPGFSDTQIALADRLQQIADESGIKPATLALAWLISRPALAAAIIGPETVEELETAARAADLELPVELLSQIDAISKPTFDYY